MEIQSSHTLLTFFLSFLRLSFTLTLSSSAPSHVWCHSPAAHATPFGQGAVVR